MQERAGQTGCRWRVLSAAKMSHQGYPGSKGFANNKRRVGWVSPVFLKKRERKREKLNQRFELEDAPVKPKRDHWGHAHMTPAARPKFHIACLGRWCLWSFLL